MCVCVLPLFNGILVVWKCSYRSEFASFGSSNKAEFTRLIVLKVLERDGCLLIEIETDCFPAESFPAIFTVDD